MKKNNAFENENFLDYGIVFGKAFKIKTEYIQETLDYLDFREKGGYERKIVDIFCEEKVMKGLLYTGNINNPNFTSVEIR